MWFRLTNAQFIVNIGTLDQYTITTSGSGFTYSGPAYWDKSNNGNYEGTITLLSGYTLDNITVTMGGATQSGAVTDNENGTYTINLARVTGDIKITVSTTGSSSGGGGSEGGGEPTDPTPGGAYTLVQGYVSGATVDNELNTRVRIDGLVSGPFSVECNDGYLIRAIQECSSTTPSASDANIVVAEDKETSYSGGSAGKYYAITFCKTSASSSISPTENILKSFSGTVVAIGSGDSTTDDTVAGTDVNYTLRQGAWVESGSLYNGTNRVCTTEKIKGKFTVTVNDGFAIRAVYQYNANTGAGTMVSKTSETLKTFTSSNDSQYYGVTFTYASPNAENDIAPTENIIASWKYV